MKDGSCNSRVPIFLVSNGLIINRQYVFVLFNEMKVGSMVKFNWWSNYKAASIAVDQNGHVSWHEVHPGDTGIIFCINEDAVVVLFSSVDTLLKVHKSMLEVV